MACRYLGSEVRTYPQYMNLGADQTLVAVPGGTYDLAPAGGLNLPVPPADGLWEDAEPDPPVRGGGKEAGSEAASAPPPLMTGSSTEGEE